MERILIAEFNLPYLPTLSARLPMTSSAGSAMRTSSSPNRDTAIERNGLESPIYAPGATPSGRKRKASETPITNIRPERRKITRACDSCKRYIFYIFYYPTPWPRQSNSLLTMSKEKNTLHRHPSVPEMHKALSSLRIQSRVLERTASISASGP